MVFYVVGLDNWERLTLNALDKIPAVNNSNQSSFIPSFDYEVHLQMKMYIFPLYLDVIAINKQVGIVYALTPSTAFSWHCVLCPCFISPGKGNCRNQGTGDEND